MNFRTQFPQNRNRIAVVFQGRYPTEALAAGERRVRDLSNGLAQSGCKVDFLCPGYFGAFAPSPSSDLFRLVHLGGGSRKTGVMARYHFWNEVTRYAKRENIAFALFYNTSIDSFTAIRSLGRCGIRCGLEVCDLHSLSRHRIAKRACYWLGEHLLPKCTDLNIAISSGIQKFLARTAPKVSVIRIPGLVDREYFSPRSVADGFRLKYGIPSDRLIVSFTGSWFRQKGMSTLARAFRESCTSTGSNPLLVIAGSSTNSELEDCPVRLGKELGIESQILTPGYLSGSNLVQLLRETDIAVSASENDTFSEYSFPTKLAEFAAMGKSIVTTSVGDVPEYFVHQKNAMLCNPSDWRAMSNCISKLLQSPELRKTIATSAMAIAAEAFSTQNAGNMIRNKISELFGQQLG